MTSHRNLPAEADTPEGRRHAEEAQVLRELLDMEGTSRSEKEGVFPTRDFRGHVSLNFKQAWDLLGYSDYEHYQRVVAAEEEGGDGG